MYTRLADDGFTGLHPLKRWIIANWRVLNYYDDLAGTRRVPRGSNDKGYASLKAFVKRSYRRDLTNRAIFRYHSSETSVVETGERVP